MRAYSGLGRLLKKLWSCEFKTVKPAARWWFSCVMKTRNRLCEARWMHWDDELLTLFLTQ